MGAVRNLAALGVLIGGLAGCDANLPDMYKEAGTAKFAAEQAQTTDQSRALMNVPRPARKLTVSVFDMPDLSGQYKETNTGQNLSRAVTQGGADILIKSLMEAGGRRWFNVLDRAALDSLLKERQIVTEMRRIYRGEAEVDAAALGPMDHAGVMIQGAIVGYDSNIVSGGLGAQYLGIGANRRYKLDVVTVSLRAIATETGEVLAAVMVRKPIASISTQGNVFRYVALDEILESELGVAMNEPKQLAIEAAIQKAVLSLIAEGVDVGLWDFADPAAGRAFLEAYRREKYGEDAQTVEQVSERTKQSLTIPRTVPAKPEPEIPVIRQVDPQNGGAVPPVDESSDEVLG